MSKVMVILTSRPIAYHPVLAKVAGGVKAAVMLSQLIYWTPRAENPDGWVRKDAGELEEETGLTRKEQAGARAELLGRGLIEYDVRGVPATSHYRVVTETLESVLPDGAIQFSPNVKTGFTRKGKLDLPDGENFNRTETTTETTTDIKQESDNEKAPLSVAAKAYFAAFNRKRWANPEQAKAFAAAEALHGEPAMLKAIEWAALNNIPRLPAIFKCAAKIAKQSSKPAPGAPAANGTRKARW